MPQLDRITVYPIKSLDGVEVRSSTFVDGGGLWHDRRFALRDKAGKFVNGKRFPTIHAIRAVYDADFASVQLSTPRHLPTTFRLSAGSDDLQRWFSDYFGFDVLLEENDYQGFPDDLDSPGPTILSTATLSEVATWYPGLSLDEVRRRFRANLEIGDAPAFWEDRLFGAEASPETRTVVPFRVGAVELGGVNPCARCAVPPRDTQTGEVWPKFVEHFQRRRRETLPPWTAATAFSHFYRLSINTRPSPVSRGGTISVGDEITLVDD